jgi:hypothetical protein
LRKIVGGLPPNPDIGRRAESFGQSNGHLGGNTRLSVDEAGESDPANPERFCAFRDGQAERFEAVEPDGQARVRGILHRGAHRNSSFILVVVDQFNIVSVTGRKGKNNPPVVLTDTDQRSFISPLRG